MNTLRQIVEWTVLALIGAVLILLVLGVAADADEPPSPLIVGYCTSAIPSNCGGQSFFAIRDDGTYRNIPEPKFDAPQLDWRPKSAVLDDGNYEITYPEKIIHEGNELSGQVCREGKSIAISASKNKTRAQVQAEIITQIFKLTGEDSETMVRFVEHNRTLVDFLLELSVTEMLK